MTMESRSEMSSGKNAAQEGTTRQIAGPFEGYPSLLINTIPFAANIVDAGGRTLFCNTRMKLLARRDVTGEVCWEASRADSGRCDGCPLASGIEAGETRTTELTDAFGGRTFRVTHSALRYNGKNAVLQILEDITEKRKKQLELAQVQKLESIGTLASGIAHDFNNLLGIIVGNAALIERSATDPLKVVKRAKTINLAAERGSSLVRQLLKFARKSEPAFSAVSMNRIVDDISKLFDETFPKSMRLLCNLSEDLPMVNGDPTQIHQVMLNLMVNAKDAMCGSGDLIISTEAVSAEVVRRLFPTATSYEYVVVGISDNGSGMSREVLEHIFEPFFTTKGEADGTGLGLSVVFGIMEEHHGFVNVQSEPGRGTTFSLYFPAQHSRTVRSVPVEFREDEVPGGDETILIVEDEEMLNELLASILTSRGYKVLRTWNGREAVEAYAENQERISLVISDYGLPNLTGCEVLTWMKETSPNVKFILSTGYVDPNERTTMIENGAREIVLKPYRPSDLLKKVRRVLDLP